MRFLRLVRDGLALAAAALGTTPSCSTKRVPAGAPSATRRGRGPARVDRRWSIPRAIAGSVACMLGCSGVAHSPTEAALSESCYSGPPPEGKPILAPGLPSWSTCYVSGILSAVGEPALSTKLDVDSYRMIWMRTQDPPVIVRVVRKPGDARFVAKVPARDYRSMSYDASGRLTEKQWTELRQAFDEARAELLATPPKNAWYDASYWIMEWSVGGEAAAEKLVPAAKEPKVTAFAKAMLQLSELPMQRSEKFE